jgi:hypothetical protein
MHDYYNTIGTPNWQENKCACVNCVLCTTYTYSTTVYYVNKLLLLKVHNLMTCKILVPKKLCSI